MTNDIANEVTQQKYNNIKLLKMNIYIYIYIYIDNIFFFFFIFLFFLGGCNISCLKFVYVIFLNKQVG